MGVFHQPAKRQPGVSPVQEYERVAIHAAVVFDVRHPESSYIEKIWRTTSVPVDTFVSVAVPQWEMVVTSQRGETRMTVRGPETKASMAGIPQDADFVGVQFRLGAFMPKFPLHALVDRWIELPEAARGSFWLDSAIWQFPSFDNADLFVDRLVRHGLLVREVDPGSAERTAQRRSLRSTGLNRRAIWQIERARRAAELIQLGAAPRDVAWRAGYADQAHLTRALKRFVGMTPRQLSESFKTRRVR
jgi:Helix-turn-helix domain